jgi:hypothetical protein
MGEQVASITALETHGTSRADIWEFSWQPARPANDRLHSPRCRPRRGRLRFASSRRWCMEPSRTRAFIAG